MRDEVWKYVFWMNDINRNNMPTSYRQLCYLDTCTCMTKAVARDGSCTCQCLVVKAPTH